MSKEVMRQALEALEAGEYYLDDLEAIVYEADDLGTHEDRAKMQEAITALREALAEQPAQQEPVAWASDVEFDSETEVIPAKEKGRLGTAGLNIPLYTSPPAQRTWVGLTDEEKADLFEGTAPYYNEADYADAIEAKLKEKNT